MNANLENIAEELFGKIRTRFPEIKLGDEKSGVIDNDENISQARFFEFDYIKDGVSLGSITIKLSEKDGMTVMYSNDIAEDQPQTLVNEWYKFLRSLREFAGKRLLKFNTRDIVKSNLDKRDYNFLAKNSGEGQMNESKLRGTNRTSFQDVGEAKIIVRHSQNVNYDNPAGRTLHIESIFIENANGERFLYPHKHLNGARALAQHVAHGGTPYDDIGQHVIGLSEELSKLRFFKGYVSRQDQISEAMGSVTDKVIERIDQVKKEIHQLQSSAHYNSFVESFTRSETQQIPEDTVNDWVDKLTVRNFNEALKDVFPYIYKLVGENDSVKEIDADDLLGEDTEEKCDDCHKPIDDCECDDHDHDDDGKKIREFAEFEYALESIVSEGEGIASTDEEVQNAAIEKLNDLLSQNLNVGVDGTNAKLSLKDVIDDNEFIKMLDDAPAETNLNALIKGWVETNHEELLDKLTFPAEGEAAAPAPAEAPPEAAAPAAPAAPAETPVAENGEEMHVHRPANGAEKLFSDIKERVSGFFNASEGTMTIGEEGFVTKMCKELKEKYNIEPGTHKADRFDQMVERACHKVMEKYKHHHDMAHLQDEHDRMLELAGVGVGEAAKWRDPKYKDKLYTQDPVADDEDDFYNDSDYYEKSRPENDPGKKHRMGGVRSEFHGWDDEGDPLSHRHNITKHSDDPNLWGYGTISSKGPRKGLPTKSVVNSLKDKIKNTKHHEPNLPESAELTAMLKIAGLR